MAIYVDKLLNRGMRLRGKLYASCHLMADSFEELCNFCVKELDIPLAWIQINSDVPHVDLVRSLRDKAITKGAEEIDNRQVVDIIRKYRKSKSKK